MGWTELSAKQQQHLEAITGWAEKSRRVLGRLLELHGNRVHFRPASKASR
jgi:hypothetical protein